MSSAERRLSRPVSNKTFRFTSNCNLSHYLPFYCASLLLKQAKTQVIHKVSPRDLQYLASLSAGQDSWKLKLPIQNFKKTKKIGKFSLAAFDFSYQRSNSEPMFETFCFSPCTSFHLLSLFTSCPPYNPLLLLQPRFNLQEGADSNQVF